MLPDHERFKLHFGPYKQPKYNYDDIVECAVLGDVKIIRQSDARIPWPVGYPVGTGRRGRGNIVVFGDLKRAVETESNQAISYWWGISVATVSKWRKLLNVARKNDGTQNLFKSALTHDVDRAVKIAKAKEGVSRDAATLEKMRAAKTGTTASEETRKKNESSASVETV